MEPPSTPTIVDPLLGKTLAGRYYIEQRLGAGGMGAVYLARHVTLDKQLALKVLHGDFVHRPDLLERFLQEARAATRIRHENVIDITDFGSTNDGVVFFAMEVLEGKDLHDLVVETHRADRVLPWPRVRKIYLQICAALSAAHACGVIHRDLKPENVYLIEKLGQKDFVKLLDFGIAKLSESEAGDRKLTHAGMLFGTPEYMAPEQARGESVDHRADIYAMGCLLYLLLTGRVPFEGDSFMTVLTKQLNDPPPPISPEVLAASGTPPAVVGVIARALAKERDQRYATIDDMMAALEALPEPGDDALAGEDAAAAYAAGHANRQGTAPPAAHAHDDEARASARARSLAPGAVARPAASPAADQEAAVPGRHPSQARELPAGKRRRPVLWLGAGLVLAAGAGWGVMQWQGGRWLGLPGQGAREPAEVPAVVEPAPVPGQGAGDPAGPAGDAPAGSSRDNPGEHAEAVPARVTLTLHSEPEGARILDNAGEEVGETPLSFELPGGHEPRRFRFRLEGHYDKLVELIPSEDVDYTVALAPRPAAAPGDLAGTEGRVDTEPEVEVVPQERAQRRRRAARSRRRNQAAEETRPAPTAQPEGQGGTEPGTSTPPGDEPPARPATGQGGASGQATSKDEAPQGTGAPSSEPRQGTEQKAVEQEGAKARPPERPAPDEPDPTSDPVLKNPFSQ